MKRLSLKTAVAVPAISVLIVGVIIMVTIVGVIASASTNELTEELMESRVNEYANLFEAICNDGYAMVRTLAPLVNGIRLDSDNPREEVFNFLMSVMKGDSKTLAVWTAWEPDAFDGKDSENINKNEYHDDTGRFVPYLFRDGASIGCEPLADYDHPVDGLYYQGAKNSGRPYITDPYPYEVAGKIINIYSIAIPILENGKAIGVMGMDISLDDVTTVMNAATIMSDGYFSVLSPNGMVATHRDEAMVLEDYKTAWLKNHSAEIDSARNNGSNFITHGYSDVTGMNMELIGTGVKVGETDGYWVILGFVSEKTAAAPAANLVWIVIGIGVALIILTGLTILLLINNGLKDLPLITETAGRVANGDINFDLDHDTTPTKNEITLLERAFNAISASIKVQAEIMEKIADGDYSVSVPIRSGADIMNKAINHMLDRQNDTLGQISGSTIQVASSSKQIADGAQALAQGSTEQAATVQQLSASITDIAEKTKLNSEMASRSAQMAAEIMLSAEKGSRQMDEMMTAVSEINQASQNIGKVISVIDSIAFQTNILALNASVEAARAGQHGKGFAVVAEEVRNLAAKSAEAAKDTGELIANSIEKAELGSRIASGTAESLKEIVSGIEESSKISNEISQSSENQTSGIAQINDGIEQVAQVVQQNSATAQQSAASSEEMGAQADILEKLVGQFKLRDTGGHPSRYAALSSGYNSKSDKTGFAMSQGGKY